MPTINEQITRVRRLLQDEDGSAFSANQVLTQHQDEITRLAREHRFEDIITLQGVTDQALYTLPTTNVIPALVLYNELRLNFATEEFLDRRSESWEWQSASEPKYWTIDNQNPNTIRLVPSPQRTGSLLPIIPAAPFIMSPVDNLVIFFYLDVADTADDGEDLLPVLDVWQDLLVWRTTAEMARREGPYQNLPLAQTSQALADMWMEIIE